LGDGEPTNSRFAATPINPQSIELTCCSLVICPARMTTRSPINSVQRHGTVMQGHHEGVLNLHDAVIGDGGLDDPAVVALPVCRDDGLDLDHGGNGDLCDGLDGNNCKPHGVGHDHGDYDGGVSIMKSSPRPLLSARWRRGPRRWPHSKSIKLTCRSQVTVRGGAMIIFATIRRR